MRPPVRNADPTFIRYSEFRGIFSSRVAQTRHRQCVSSHRHAHRRMAARFLRRLPGQIRRRAGCRRASSIHARPAVLCRYRTRPGDDPFDQQSRPRTQAGAGCGSRSAARFTPIRRRNPSRSAQLRYPIPQRCAPNGLLISAASAGIAAVLLAYYVSWMPRIHSTPVSISRAQYFAATFGLGVVFRLFSESAGGTLQATGHVAADNFLQSIGELLWGAATWTLIIRHAARFECAGEVYCASGFLLLLTRGLLAAFVVRSRPVRLGGSTGTSSAS